MSSIQLKPTPRMLAWVLVLGGCAWFVHASPKTPLAFFDAANRDEAEAQERMSKRHATLDPLAADRARKFAMSSFYAQQMERIALIHDLASNPELVQKERNSIRAGSYPIQKQVKDELMATNGDYRRLAKAFGDMRAEIKAMKRPARASAGKDDHDMQVGIFTLDRMMLRQFQARIFWREGR